METGEDIEERKKYRQRDTSNVICVLVMCASPMPINSINCSQLCARDAHKTHRLYSSSSFNSLFWKKQKLIVIRIGFGMTKKTGRVYKLLYVTPHMLALKLIRYFSNWFIIRVIFNKTIHSLPFCFTISIGNGR